MLAGDFCHAGDTTTGNIDFADGQEGVPVCGQDLAWLGVEVENFQFGHISRFSTIRAAITSGFTSFNTPAPAPFPAR